MRVDLKTYSLRPRLRLLPAQGTRHVKGLAPGPVAILPLKPCRTPWRVSAIIKRRKDENNSLQTILGQLKVSSKSDRSYSGYWRWCFVDNGGWNFRLGVYRTFGDQSHLKTASNARWHSVQYIHAPVAPSKRSAESSKISDEAEISAKASDDHGLNYPVIRSTSWKPSASFSKFLDNNSRQNYYFTSSLLLLWMTGQLFRWKHSLLQNTWSTIVESTEYHYQLPKDVFTRRFYDKDVKDAYLSFAVHESSRRCVGQEDVKFAIILLNWEITLWVLRQEGDIFH